MGNWSESLAALNAPEIHPPLPGPKAKELIERDNRYTSPSYTRMYPLAVARGAGAMLEDLDGNRFLDFTAGIAVCTTGHAHPRVVAAIERQARNLLHMSGTDFYYGPQADLAERLAKLAPGDRPRKVLFTNSGTEAVEAAIKLARYHTGRSKLIAFQGGFHGRTMGALSLTASKYVQRKGFGPLLGEVYHIGYANPYRPQYDPVFGDVGAAPARFLEEVLFKQFVPPDEVAAIVVEPIQGEGGYIVPPPNFHRELKALAERHGILYVADEVQTGMGRTGKMFAMEHWEVVPDIICVAKGIASGMPLGAIIADAQIMNWPPGAHASTFGGNPVSCVAALETIALLEEGLLENAARVGEFLLERLGPLADTHPQVGDVRGRGLMLALELVEDRHTKKPAVAMRDRLIQCCFERGLLLLPCGQSSIRLSPPLVIREEQAVTAVKILSQTLYDCECLAGPA